MAIKLFLYTLIVAISSLRHQVKAMACPEDTFVRRFGDKEACCGPDAWSFEECFPRCDPFHVTEFTTKNGDVFKYHRMEECDCNGDKRRLFPPTICPAGMTLKRFEDPVDTLCCPRVVTSRQECHRYCIPHKGMNAREKYQGDIDSGKLKCLCFAGKYDSSRMQSSSASSFGASILLLLVVTGTLLVIFN